MLVLKTNTTLLYKDLLEWWNEETEYFFQRIRKSATLARGYNRMSLERLSEDRFEKFDLLNQMKALYGILEDKERELRAFIRDYLQRMRENEATLGLGNEADRSLSLAACLADKEVALLHATIMELQRALMKEGGGGGGGACSSDQ
ncbi:liprin-beta-2 isoform X5 [Vespula squamosa]|uniref:Liprin-beta-2 isoform X5 n=1 Tax=Vespula squamosa TaxID=30214 RepID=A0ABD2BHD2_VESSQ